MNIQPNEILTIDEVALYLKVGKRTVYGLTVSRQLPALKPGGSWRCRWELGHWIARRAEKAAGLGKDECT